MVGETQLLTETVAPKLDHGDEVWIGVDEGWAGQVVGTHQSWTGETLVVIAVPSSAIFTVTKREEPHEH